MLCGAWACGARRAWQKSTKMAAEVAVKINTNAIVPSKTPRKVNTFVEYDSQTRMKNYRIFKNAVNHSYFCTCFDEFVKKHSFYNEIWFLVASEL